MAGMDAGMEAREAGRALDSKGWTVGLRGMLAGIFGFFALSAPLKALATLVILFGAYSIMDGGLRLMAGVERAREGRRAGPQALAGAAGIAAGLVLLMVPRLVGIGLALFAWVTIALWALVTGLLELAGARRLRGTSGHTPLRTLVGLLTTGLGIWMLFLFFTRPQGSLPLLGTLLGIYALASGVLLVLLAIRIHRLARPAPAGTRA